MFVAMTSLVARHLCRLTPAISGRASRRPNCESNLGDGLDGPLHCHGWMALCRRLEVLSNDPWMARCDFKQRKSRPVGLSPTLFPIPQGMDTNLHGTGELRLAQPDKSSECGDIIPRGHAFPCKPSPKLCWDSIPKLLV